MVRGAEAAEIRLKQRRETAAIGVINHVLIEVMSETMLPKRRRERAAAECTMVTRRRC